MPATSLECLAARYPSLRFLSIRLATNDRFASLEDELPQTHVAASLTLTVSVHYAPRGGRYGNHVAMRRLLAYVILFEVVNSK